LTIFGLGEGALRFSIFAAIFLVMTALEAWLPRRARRFPRGRRWFTNLGVLLTDYLAVAAVTFVIPITAALTADWAEANGVGLFHILDWPDWIEWIIAFVVLDFVIWGQHVATHKVPILWRVHRVHHSDEDLDATTAVRFHPIEIILSIFVKSAAVVLLGAPAVLVVLFEAVVNGSAVFNHANARLPLWLDRILRLAIVTPDMHRVHHSVINRETDSNYGFALSVWDRVFRTYNDQPEMGHDGMTIGLSDWQDEAPTRLGWTLGLPFRNPPKSPPVSKS
jgi:sterol desaturase/sphingolipid hydroxylase (fatty acid hydroxylase superfamily)